MENYTQFPDTNALHRKTLKKMIFLYMSLLNGWQIKLIEPDKFEFRKDESSTNFKSRVEKQSENYDVV